MRLPALRACAAIMTGGLAACSLFVDWAELHDAAPVEGDAGPTDGGPASDALVDGDASNDAAIDCDANFCDDFDEGPIGGRWSAVRLEGGALSLIGENARSHPNALRSSLTDTSAQTAFLEQDFGDVKAVRCEFDLWVASVSTEAHVNFFTVLSSDPASRHELFFATRYGKELTLREDIFFTEGGCDCPRQQSSLPRLGPGWTRVRVETDFTRAAIAYNGEIVLVAAFGGFDPTSVKVQLGTRSYRGSTADVRYDNLACAVTR